MTKMNTFGIVFYLRRQKEKNGRASVYDRITVDGKKTNVSLKKTSIWALKKKSIQ